MTGAYASALFAIALFKIAVVAAGVGSIYLGYRLFSAGVFAAPAPGKQSAELEARVGEYKLTFRRAAPGTIFALFGAVLVGITAARGFSFSIKIPPPKEMTPKDATPGTIGRPRDPRDMNGTVTGATEAEERVP